MATPEETIPGEPNEPAGSGNDLRVVNAELRTANQRLRSRVDQLRGQLAAARAETRPEDVLGDDRAMLQAARHLLDAGHLTAAHRALALIVRSESVGPQAGAALRRLAALAEGDRDRDLELICRVDLLLSGHASPVHLKRAMTICTQQESEPKLVVVVEWLLDHDPAVVRDTLNGVYFGDLSRPACAYLSEVCERLTGTFPGDGRLRYRWAELQDQLGLSAEAKTLTREAYSHFVAAPELDPEQRFYSAVAALACGEMTHARTQFDWLCEQAGRAPTRAMLRHLDHLFRLVGDTAELRDALDRAAACEIDAATALMLAELRVVVGDEELAEDAIADLVDLEAEDLPHQEALLAAWWHARRGDLDAARTCHRRTVWPLSDRWFNALGSDSLKYLVEVPGQAGAATALESGELPMFAVLKNEMARIEAFLDHYRGLGVTTFFMVDNDSDDGGLELLQAQPDVYCFHAHDGIRQSHYGVRWLNHLMQQHAPDHWVLTADLDEHLVYRESDAGTNLGAVIDRLEREGAMMLRSFMLDVFPRTTGEIRAPQSAAHMVETHRYLDADYSGLGLLDAPYGDVIGGARRRVGNPPAHPTLVKTPLFNTGAGIEMNCVTHTVTPGSVAAEGGVLLHYKFASDPLERSRYSSHSPQENWAHRFLDVDDLRGPHSVELTGTAQLADLGYFDLRPTSTDESARRKHP